MNSLAPASKTVTSVSMSSRSCQDEDGEVGAAQAPHGANQLEALHRGGRARQVQVDDSGIVVIDPRVAQGFLRAGWPGR